MYFDYVMKFVIYSAFGTLLGWYLCFIGYGIRTFFKWCKKKLHERKMKKAE